MVMVSYGTKTVAGQMLAIKTTEEKINANQELAREI
jgi:hypothetical protein